MNGKGFPGEGARGRGPLPSPPPAIINPTREPGEAPVSARVVLSFARADYQLLCRLSGAAGPPRYLWDCAYRRGVWGGRPLTIAAPAPGAPYAALVLEKLIALGARAVLALGWCGSLHPGVRIGSLVLPTAARRGDGTSPHYCPGDREPEPHPLLLDLLRRQLAISPAPWQSGAVWTTDAFYRETVELVRRHQARGLLAVEMEMAALFAVGEFRRVPVAGLLVVSDELFTLDWRPGYRSAPFRRARDLAARLLLNAAAAWGDDGA
jgi:purine-nucleoside phosphorylase